MNPFPSRSSVLFHGTVLRDGHQSLAATRMTTAQMVPALELLDRVGFAELETWGGATVDSGLRFLNEFPFERLDRLKAGTPNTPHGMLLRGQNLVGYAPQPDDVVEAFVAASARHGMNVFRVFDALNDILNVEAALRAVKKAGMHAQGTICYTKSPVHRLEGFVAFGKELAALGCDSICVKDMAGLLAPEPCKSLVKALKEALTIPVIVHTHDTAGLGATTLFAAVEAGADAIDTGISPFGDGTGQPDTRRMLELFEGNPRKPKFDLEALRLLEEHFRKVYGELSAFTRPENERIDGAVLAWQVPGGMLSNFRQQLEEQKMTDRFEEVVKEIPVVREALGWVPLVTPTSQIVGVQAVLNVKFGRWKQLSPAAAEIALGGYGRTPGPVDPIVLAQARKVTGKEPYKGRAADSIPPAMDRLRAELVAKGSPSDDEHVVLHAQFPRELDVYLKAKSAPKPVEKPIEIAPKAPAPAPVAVAPAPAPVAAAPVAPLPTLTVAGPAGTVGRLFRMTVEGKSFEVLVEEHGGPA